jgi:Tfp pilus assembly protein PilF
LQRALAINEKHYGPYHLEVAITLTNLGVSYGDMGNNTKKFELLQRALAIEEKHYGHDHPEVAITLNNVGNSYA